MAGMNPKKYNIALL